MIPPAGGLAPGQILGNRYRIVALLGRGGMGEVWQAYDLKLQVDVALKSIRAERFPGEQGLELLRREVRTAREVMSPNVCRIFDLVDEEGQEFVSMEYVDGATLLDVLRERGPLDLQEATRLASQFLAGLEAIHQAGLVHRDVKPENIMITRTGRVLLMDFGIAKAVAEEGHGTIAGTPAYMAPEHLRGETPDARADIFAAGVVLAEMIAPDGVRAHKSRESLWQTVRQTPVRLFESPWRGVLERAVASEPAQRYATARALARALEEVTLRVEGAEDKKPYPGLESFTEADAEFFFGREIEVEATWKKLQRANLLAIIGPSGAGKTSFLQAGLLPARPAEWQHVLLRPGSSPFVALAQTLVPHFVGDTEAIQQLMQAERIDPLLAVLGRWREKHRQVLVVVDQFEELFTLCRAEVQSGFAELIGRLAIATDVHVLLVMRDDFLFHCHAHARLAPIFSELTPIGPPAGSALRRALVQPALLCGYRLEDESMADEMLGEIAGERGALPMLAFAAARLWEERDRERGLLTRETYQRIGGVSGALAQHAEATLERIGAERQGLVREIFRNLVTAQGTRAVSEVDELLSVFEDRQAAGEVLRELVNARLLTSFELPESREGAAARQRIEIVHESLLTSWPRLVHWQTQDTEGAQLRDQLRQAAHLWKERHESDDLLWTGTAYKEFELWREQYPGGLTETEEAFGEAMGARAQRDRRRRRVAMGTVLALLLGVIAVISWYGNQQKLMKRTAEAGKLVVMGRNELAENPTGALAYAIASLEVVDNPSNRRFALEALSREPMAFLMPSQGWPRYIDFSPDGKRLGVSNLQGLHVYSFDGSAPTILEEYQYDSPPRGRLQFAPDNDRVCWSDTKDRSLIRVWSLSQGTIVRTLRMEGPTDLFAGKHQVFLRTTVSENPRSYVLRGWAYDGGEPTLIGRFSDTEWESFALDPNGQWVAYTKDRGVYVRRLQDRDGTHARLLGEHPFKTHKAALIFDPVGERIASADTSGEIRIWSVASDSKFPVHMLHGTSPVRHLEFDPAGTILAAVCGRNPDFRVCLWDLEGPLGALPITLRLSGQNPVSFFPNFCFDPSGYWLVVPHFTTIAFWPIGRFNRYVLPGSLGEFTPDGSVVVYYGDPFGTGMRIQDLVGGPPRDLWQPQQGKQVRASFHRDGQYMAVAGESGVHVVSLADGQVRPIPMDPPGRYGTVFAISPDGQQGATIRVDENAGICVWDLQTNTARLLQESKGLRSHRWLTYAVDGSLYSGDAEGRVRRWNLADGASTVVYESKLSKRMIAPLLSTRDPRYLVGVECTDSVDQTYAGVVNLFDVQNHISRTLETHGSKVWWCALDSTRTLLMTLDYGGAVRVGPISGEEPHVLVVPPLGQWAAISPDGKWIAAPHQSDTVRESFCLLRTPEGPPLHTLPHEELLGRLRSRTNLRIVPDKSTETGYRLDKLPFPGWEKVPVQ